MKFLKKAVSALLASVMCIPAGILSFAEAEENTVTTVTLSNTENGFMQFSKACMESSTASQDGYHMVEVNEGGTGTEGSCCLKKHLTLKIGMI